MAFIKCSGGAGKLKETLLWQNPNPTKSFAAQTITLNEPMNTFEFLKIICNYTTSNTTNYFKYCFLITDLMNNAGCGINIGGLTTMSGNYGKVRTMSQYKSATEIQFLSGHGWNNTENTAAVPLYVYGLK